MTETVEEVASTPTSTPGRTERHERNEHSERQHVQVQAALNERGKRSINMVWEITQACIALAVTGAGLYAGLKGYSSESLNNTLFLVIGFYFGRTNHARPTTVYKAIT